MGDGEAGESHGEESLLGQSRLFGLLPLAKELLRLLEEGELPIAIRLHRRLRTVPLVMADGGRLHVQDVPQFQDQADESCRSEKTCSPVQFRVGGKGVSRLLVENGK